MNKEQKVISLPLAKEFQKVAKENGFELPESEYMWERKMGEWRLIHKDYYKNQKYDTADLRIWIQAYDTSELGEMLRIERGSIVESYSSISENVNYWTCKFIQGIQELKPHLEKHRWESFHGESEAEVRGKMFYYLLDNDLL